MQNSLTNTFIGFYGVKRTKIKLLDGSFIHKQGNNVYRINAISILDDAGHKVLVEIIQKIHLLL